MPGAVDDSQGSCPTLRDSIAAQPRRLHVWLGSIAADVLLKSLSGIDRVVLCIQLIMLLQMSGFQIGIVFWII